MWHNSDKRQDVYNNWNFTNIVDWDTAGPKALWWSVNTTALAKTVTYKIGEESIDTINLQVEPQRKIFKEKIPAKKVFGLVTEWKDEVI